ncbi:MAG: ArsR/SmtB family transcription factor [Candidatus Dormibacteria bacterium]
MSESRVAAPEPIPGHHSTDRMAAYQLHAELCKVLTDPKRLMILDALRQGEQSVGSLAQQLEVSLANASQHLGVLRHSGLVEVRRAGTTMHYRLSEPRITQACDIVNAIVVSRLGTGWRLGSELQRRRPTPVD